MRKILLLIFLTAPMFASAFDFEGTWHLIGQRCDSPSGALLYKIDRFETRMGIFLTLSGDHFTETVQVCHPSVLASGGLTVIGDPPLTLKMKQSAEIFCNVDGLSMHSSRGLEDEVFSYVMEGALLIENHEVCADGKGRWKWIYERVEAPTS